VTEGKSVRRFYILCKERSYPFEQEICLNWIFARSLRKSVYLWIGALTAVVTKSSIFWDITPCSPLKINLRFGRICRLSLQEDDKNKVTQRYTIVTSNNYAVFNNRYLPTRACCFQALRLLTMNDTHTKAFQVYNQQFDFIYAVKFSPEEMESVNSNVSFFYKIYF
jgi:hypothetical protein